MGSGLLPTRICRAGRVARTLNTENGPERWGAPLGPMHKVGHPVHLYYTAVGIGLANSSYLGEGPASTVEASPPVGLRRVSALTSYSRLASLKVPLILPVLTLLGWCILCVALSWALSPRGVQAEGGADEPTTPAATVVTPVVATVIPAEEVVTPVSGMAEVTTGSAQQIGGDSGGSGNPFTGVRGGLFGAGIALGVVVVATVVVRGARALVKQRHQ